MAEPTRKVQGAYPVAQILPPLNPFLGLIPKALWKRVKDFFAFTVEWLPLAISESASKTFSTQGDSDFLILSGVRVVSTVNNLTETTFPPMLVKIEDSGSGRNMMDKAVHIENLFGSAKQPMVWPYPKLIRANSTVTVTLQNLSAASAFNARLSFLGFKVFGMTE